jgi:hypothetical protein
MQMLLNDGFNNIKHDGLNSIIKRTKNGWMKMEDVMYIYIYIDICV